MDLSCILVICVIWLTCCFVATADVSILREKSQQGHSHSIQAKSHEEEEIWALTEASQAPQTVFETSLEELDGSVFVSTIDGQLHALDLKTGKYKWTIDTGDPLLHASSNYPPEPDDSKQTTKPSSHLHHQHEDDYEYYDYFSSFLHPDEPMADLNDIEVDLDITRASRRSQSPAEFSAEASSSSVGYIPGIGGSLFSFGANGFQKLPVSLYDMIRAVPFQTQVRNNLLLTLL